MAIRGTVNLFPINYSNSSNIYIDRPESERFFVYKKIQDLELVAFISGGDRIHYINSYGGYDKIDVVGTRYRFIRYLTESETVTLNNIGKPVAFHL